ncbi:MAG TPA: 3-oxoacyl-[acyl-carrier-protein] synthase III C-terminal domain-containing protein [Burkholderiaceae bacterium]|jgi:3-oxoacyl-[acyl-carrier-protein] synthase-3
MSEVFVNHLTYELGDVINTVQQSADEGRTLSSVETLHKAGFTRHHVCSPDTNAYVLAKRAVEKIRDKLGHIDAIIYATCLPINGNIGAPQDFQDTRDVKYLMDFPGSNLQANFDLSDAMVIGLNQQACTAMLGSLFVSKAIMSIEPNVNRVLCITADRFPENAIYEQAYNLISDGAAACIVSRDPEGFRIVTTHAVTNGAMSLASDDETVGSFFNYTHRVIQETLAKANLTIADIDWIVPQNTNIIAWQIMCNLLPFDHARIHHPTLGQAGHVISGDNIINLKHLVDSGDVRKGEKLLLFMAGYGLNWQCVILEKV